MTARLRASAILLLTTVCCGPANAEPWHEVLSRMPLLDRAQSSMHQTREPLHLTGTNVLTLMVSALQPNAVVKALIFLPGATDEFYMFHRASARVTNASPSLLEAVTALTNQTLIRATFRAPLLLLHTDEDPLEPVITEADSKLAAKLRQMHTAISFQWIDRDWDAVLPVLNRATGMDIWPGRNSHDSWHFYRHSLAAWNLTPWEAVEAVALAGKSSVTVRRDRSFLFPQEQLRFVPDTRIRERPKL